MFRSRADNLQSIGNHLHEVGLGRVAEESNSQTDELTGIANRRFVMARIDDMLIAVSGGGVGCLAVFDIDNFKLINDRHGHDAGDLVLRDFAHRLHQHVRRIDCFGRVGGEEFVLVMSGTKLEDAIELIERMLTTIRFSRPLNNVPDFGYTCSAGIAACLETDSAPDLYRRADQALYEAKLSGRDRVRAA